MTPADLYLLAPEISMVGLAVLVVVLDLTVGSKRLLGAVAVIGLALPAALTIMLWGEVSGWWSLLDRMPGEVAGHSIPGVYGTFSVDHFALFFKLMFTGIAALVILASTGAAGRIQRLKGEYYALILTSATGMMLLATATELITLYIALELSALPMVALVALTGEARSTEAGIKLLLLGALSSAVLLYGMVLTFGFTGTTHLAEIATAVSSMATEGGEPFGGPLMLVAVVLIVAGFGFKIAVVPFQMWVPDVYEGAPTPITAYLSVASKAAGFAVLLRVFHTAFGSMEMDWSLLFAGIAAASMTIGNLVAVAQSNIKRMLGYSTIAHAGYILVGLAAVASRTGDDLGIGANTLLFYLVGYAFTNLATFFAVIAITNKTGNEAISGFAGMGRRAPLLALVLAVGLISLTGIPPTVGFMAKLFIFSAAVKADLAWLALVGLVNSVVSAYYYLRVVRSMYLAPPESEERITAPPALKFAVGLTALGVLALGIWPQALLSVAELAGLALRP
jgi:NADH-quinone oxidoreductase subunit N